MDTQERREFLRVVARLPMSCLAVDADGQASLLRVNSMELSAGGVSVLCAETLGIGQTVRLSFQAGEPPETLRIEATVARAKPREDGLVSYALEFSSLDPVYERRLVQAVFAHERANAGRHEQVRMSVWHPVRCTPAGGEEVGAHATSISTDDVCIVTRHPFQVGDRVRVSITDAGLAVAVNAWATVSEATLDGRGNLACTLLLDHLDRVARSAVLRSLMEAERRQLAGE